MKERESMTAKNGDKVKVHYTGTLDDGTEFDSSRKREPLEFTIGQRQLLQKFEDSVIGMSTGESVKVHIPAEEGYGVRREELVGKIPVSQLPPDLKPEIGMQLQMQTQQGQNLMITVTDISDAEVTVDANHRLAGEALNFDIELVEIA